jgi:D-alanyl-D-alanine carboxypeptidase
MAFCGLKSKVARVAKAAAGACVALSTLTALTAPAEAHYWRHYRHYYHHAYAAPRTHRALRHYYAARPTAAPAVGPGFAAVVVDANTGRTLYASHDEELRHPASLTKVMTLYMLFEQLESGRLTLDSPIAISERAAAQAPTKLGLAPGQTIRVDDAIKAIVTRSANDIAVAIAEAVGGSEENFAAMMTHKAHALGMERTNYHNASGLPDDAQITTAHDLSILGRAVQERFPRYFKYFSIQSFEYAGEIIGNHDHLLGRIDGVDGIKTGYTRASGFNLLTSLHREGRSVVAVVMGGRSAASRDAIMANLLAVHVAEASSGGHSATMIAENNIPEAAAAAQAPVELTRAAAPLQLAAARLPPAKAAPVLVATADIPKPPARELAAASHNGEGDTGESDAPAPRLAAIIPASKIKGRFIPAPVAPVAKAAQPTPAVAQTPQPASIVAKTAAGPIVAAAKSPAQLGWVKGPDPAPQGATAAGKDAKLVVAALPTARPREETSVARNEDSRPAAGDAWMIQIGATDDAGKATILLNRARAQTRSTLASARPFTEKVQKGDSAFYRARFAGLDSVTAESACKSLKKAGFSCFPTQN